ncbi:MAG: hypothetical protein ACREJQ_08370 [bacterium]
MEDHVKEYTELIEDLRQVVEKGRMIPLLKQELLDGESLKQIVSRLRDTLPDALSAASRVINQREEILREAHAEHGKLVNESAIVHEAKSEHARILKETEQKAQAVLAEARRKAEQAADEIRKEADRYAQKSKEKIFNYALDLLKNVHESLGASMDNLSEARNTLQASTQVIEEWMQKIVQEKEKA